ncbi:hypothetical protein WN51_07389 [Melipona quadrifasciata]|uniref:Uncharacterized protein n=1 Tax=Melipona quadrifasciata TaxID=166423 RepID=A0A0M8ZRE2_9HYME|nr:hypothetical protein WN51_07389 [Melipona quadrifasciata]
MSVKLGTQSVRLEIVKPVLEVVFRGHLSSQSRGIKLRLLERLLESLRLLSQSLKSHLKNRI